MNTLPGDWRRRTGTKTDAHLFVPSRLNDDADRLPMCDRNIPRSRTSRAKLWTGTPVSRSNETRALPCTSCLVAFISKPYTRRSTDA